MTGKPIVLENSTRRYDRLQVLRYALNFADDMWIATGCLPGAVLTFLPDRITVIGPDGGEEWSSFKHRMSASVEDSDAYALAVVHPCPEPNPYTIAVQVFGDSLGIYQLTVMDESVGLVMA
jgi:hypothetical protein